MYGFDKTYVRWVSLPAVICLLLGVLFGTGLVWSGGSMHCLEALLLNPIKSKPPNPNLGPVLAHTYLFTHFKVNCSIAFGANDSYLSINTHNQRQEIHGVESGKR